MIRVVSQAMWVAGEGTAADLRADLLAGRSRLAERLGRAPALARPERIANDAWRRMTRLSRAVATVGLAALDRLPDVDPAATAAVWGTAIGEITPTGAFLDRLFAEGPQATSPLAFQNSVYSAPISHLSMAIGLTGHVETLSSAGATSAMALHRGLTLLREGVARRVLVVVGDELSEPLQRASDRAGGPWPLGECVAAVVLEEADAGPVLTVRFGSHPGEGPVFARHVALPGEVGFLRPVQAIAVEPVIGLCPASGLALALAAAAGGGSVLEHDGAASVTILAGDA